MNPKRAQPQAVFLDRDGVINDEVGLIAQPEDLRLLSGVAEAIQRLNEAGILTIVVTNQPVVARGLVSEKKLKEIHGYLEKLLAEKKAHLDAIYYCPHYPGTVEDSNGDPRYLIDCSCRKPKPGLLERAKRQFHLDPKKCFMVGDHTRDIKVGRDFGCKTVLVKTGHAGEDGKFEVEPDFICRDLSEAVEEILQFRGQDT